MLGFGVFTGPGGALIGDYSTRASQLIITNGEHGFGTLACFVRMSLAESFQIYDRPGLPMVQMTEFGVVVWQGRLEDVAIVAGGVKLTALGYWRALTDIPYTALWTVTSVSNWRPVRKEDVTGYSPEMFAIDTNNRLAVALTKNTLYTNNSNFGALAMLTPDGGSRQITSFAANVDYNLPVNWAFSLEAYTSAWASLASNNITLVGGAATTSFSWDLSATPADIVLVRIWNRTGANYTMAGESGSFYLHVTSPRVKTTASASVYGDEIADALVSYTSARNTAQLSSSTALINSPTVDLRDELYQDALPADILDRLARLGDNSSPVALYETGVWEGQRVSFQKRGTTARIWYVDISALELERTIDALFNSTQADYQEPSGRTLKTATAEDTNSQSRYGVIRRKVLQAQTTSSTLAGTIRDAALQDGKDPRPRISIKFERVFDASGSVYPLWMVRAWDTMVVRNLPLTLSASLDRIRSFRVIETRYDVDRNVLTVTPEQFRPSLAVLTARNAAGIRR